MIVTNLDELRKGVQRTEFKDKEAEVVAAALLTKLNEIKDIGLSANQLGIDKRLCAFNIGEDPFYLVNPVILNRSEEQFTYFEFSCSIPRSMKKPIKTVRHEWIEVDADNIPDSVTFGPDNRDEWDDDPSAFWNDVGFLRSVLVQRQIDYLDGFTIKDKERRWLPDSNPIRKYGRNERVMFMDPATGDMEFMKFKHGEKLLDEGWVVQ